MISMNRVIIAGSLTKTPTLQETASGKKFTTFTVAINDYWKDKDGELAQKSTYVNVTCWGKLAVNVTKYLTTGKNVMVEGKLTGDSYTDANGKQHNLLRVDANSVVFCEKNRQQ